MLIKNHPSLSLPSVAAEVRTSKRRQQELENYLTGLLPARTDGEVAVRLAPIETAWVVPTDLDRLEANTKQDIPPDVRTLARSVDADYLVTITAEPAPLEEFPTDCQLTADRVHQFGLALHELLHILKTSFGSVTDLVDERIDSQYQGFVHELINTIEDGAIEREVLTGEDFSENAAAKLLFLRSVYDPDSEHRELSFGEAITAVLHDEVMITSSGVAEQLDAEDGALSFESPDAEKAFEKVKPALLEFTERAKSIRGDQTNRLYAYDRNASKRRAQTTIEFFQTTLLPILDEDTTKQSDPDGSQPSGESQGSDQDADRQQQTAGASPQQNADVGSQSEDQEDAQPGSDRDAGGDSLSDQVEDIDSSELSLETAAAETPLQDVATHPDFNDLAPDVGSEGENDSTIDGSSDAGEQHQPQESPQEQHDGHDTAKSGQEGDTASDNKQESIDAGQLSDGIGDSRESSSSGQSDPEPSPGGLANQNSENDCGQYGSSSSAGGQTTDNPDRQNGSEAASTGSAESSDQSSAVTTVGANTDIVQQRTAAEESSKHNRESGGEDEQATLREIFDSPVGAEQDQSESQQSVGEQQEQTESETQQPREDPVSRVGRSSEDNTEAQSSSSQDPLGEQTEASPRTVGHEPPTPESEIEDPSENGHRSQQQDAESQTNADPTSDQPDDADGGLPDPNEVLSKDVVRRDREEAHATASEVCIDKPAVEHELQQLEQLLTNDSPKEGSSSEAGSSGAGSESLDKLVDLPQSTDPPSPEIEQRWEAIQRGSQQVEETLRRVLELAQQDGTRRGLSAGNFEEETAYRLGIGDPRTFSANIPGEDKRYQFVLILDRSGSMGGEKIEMATAATVQFALAAESAEIDVAIIELIHGQAQLVKPTAVSVERSKKQLLRTQVGGGTPLADALRLAKSVAQNQDKPTIHCAITDDQPANPDAVIEEIQTAVDPICSITIDYDNKLRNSTAEKLAKHYTRSGDVQTRGALTERLDEFATMLEGL